jgi:hypothetical protein
MAKREPPPVKEKIQDEIGDLTWAWILFFNQMYEGDSGTSWTPQFVDLTTVGTPTYSGIYYRISQKLVYFRVTITPSTSTASTAGTTYIQNFPMQLITDAPCSVTLGVTSALGACVASSNRIYIPGWSATGATATVTGLVEAR